MQDHEATDHSFVSPWVTNEQEPPQEDDYFPNDYRIDDTLVKPLSQDLSDESI